MPTRRDNLVLFGVDSLRADHLSCCGYPRRTSPYIDRLAEQGVLFTHCYSPHIPTTSAYATMLTGRDCFSHQVVALRHEGGLPDDIPTLAEMLRAEGYVTVCIGFDGNPANRGFDRYLSYPCWADWNDRPCRKAENLNAVALPVLEELTRGDKPFFLFMRHMDPHSPYLPPEPFASLFYNRDPCDPALDTMRAPLAFKPLADYYRSWVPPGITDAEFVVAQHDGAIAYMDACIQRLLTRIDELKLTERTLVILNGDHGETLNEHDCWFDHHGLYDSNLRVPLIFRHESIRQPEKVEGPVRHGPVQHQDLVPSILSILDIPHPVPFDGQSLFPQWNRDNASSRPVRSSTANELYLTEATWMRKHGWRTPQWKLIRALEPDFHFKPSVELYDLNQDLQELRNVADEHPEVVEALTQRMNAWIERRKSETGKANPMETNLNWHGVAAHPGPFTTSQEAYDHLYVPDPLTAAQLQAGGASAKGLARKLLGGPRSGLYRRISAAVKAFRES